MLSLDFIRQHAQVVREGMRKRGELQSLDDLLYLAEQRSGLVTRRDQLYAVLKARKDDLRTAPVEQRAERNAELKAIMQDIRQLDLHIADVDTRLQLLLLSVPNLPHESVQEGCGDADNLEVRRWGEPLTFHFEPLAHWTLGERLGILDATGGVRIAGSRFVALKGMGARLERALISYMLDVHTRNHGYTEVLLPQLVKRSVLQGAGQLPKFEEQVYNTSEDELYLNPTAEVPLVGLHSESILTQDMVPLRYVAWTTAFRREAGAASRHNRGLLRLHQFNKVELFQIVAPDESYRVLEELLNHAENILRALELPYRVVALCSANLPFAASKTYDLEVWMPGQGEYVEVSSVSNCEAFQARRAAIKYRPAERAHVEYVHTLNGSGLAVGRTMAAILETYQQADGSVVVPKVLRPYMGVSTIARS